MRPDLTDDLDWLAFAYASGALDPEAEAEFEQRLDVDQTAREAVAAAVGLVGVIVRAKAPTRYRFRRAAAFATLAAAASVAAALVFAPRIASTNPPSTETVALAWSGLHGDDFLASLDDSPEPPADTATDDDDAPPSWLLEAARLRDDPSAGGPGQGS
jgi:hypothetical protein